MLGLIVLQQIVPGFEGFVTNITCLVAGHVTLQGERITESFPTDFTNCRFLTLDVVVKALFQSERITTIFTVILNHPLKIYYNLL